MKRQVYGWLKLLQIVPDGIDPNLGGGRGGREGRRKTKA